MTLELVYIILAKYLPLTWLWVWISWGGMGVLIHRWDVMDSPWPVDSGSVQCVVTSPPYWGLRDYGISGQIGLERTPGEYVEKMVAVFREVRRVLRDGGTVWLNLGDCYASGVKGSGGASKKQLSNTGSFYSLSQCFEHGLKPRDLMGMPWRVAFALQADGWWLRSDIVWAKPNPMPESIRDRPTKAHEYIFLLTKSARYYYDQDAIRQPMTAANARTVWDITPEPYPEAHFATFPTEIPRRCILAGSRSGDLVLDPFSGAGTTLLVADMLGRSAVGLELNGEYVDMALARVLAPRTEYERLETMGQTALFDIDTNS